jgi:hypothetical protein
MNIVLSRNNTAGASLRWPYTHVVCTDEGKILQLWFEFVRGGRRTRTPVFAVLDKREYVGLSLDYHRATETELKEFRRLGGRF